MAQQTGLQFTFTVEGLDASTFAVTEFKGNDTLSLPFSFTVNLASRNPSLSPNETIDRNAKLTVWQQGKLQQQWHGIVRQFVQGDTGHSHTIYQVEFVPPFARLALRQNCRIFQTQTVPEIISILLQEMGINDYNFAINRPFTQREYCAQYRESDLAFIDRIAAEEGLVYYFNHGSNKNTLIFTDNTQNVASLAEPLTYNCRNGGSSSVPFIRTFARNTQIGSSSAQLKDYSFKKPAYSFLQTSEAKEADYQQSTYEHYDYPGRYKDDENGKPFVQFRIESLRRNAHTANAKSNVPTILPGVKFTLQDHDDDTCNRDWLIIAVTHIGTQPQALEEAGGEGATTYNNEFIVIPAHRPWRPPFNVKPQVDGPQIAKVVGPEGEEIYCDTYGRVKIQFPWDRYSNSDDKASCWVRVSQGWAGSQYGMVALPRVGHEVIVSFLEGDPDQPIITGRTYNATNQPPYELPAHKTRTVLRTETHQGDGYNELRFEDQAGKEEIYVHAQKDVNVLVENDRTDNIKHNLHLDVANERFSHIKANDHLTVEGESRQHTKGNYTLAVDGSLHMKQGKALLLDAGNEVHLKAGSKIVIEAGAELTLKAGGSFVKIDASGVSISGAAINLNSGGSAGNGSGYAGVSPLLPGAIEAAAQLEQVPPLFLEALLTASQANVPLLPLCGLQTDGQCQRGEQCLCKK
ncbi:type VI secretion protein VgrG [Photobacterium kishitanii]|uniref:Type VI secretion system tip protein VgrG n=1 Tax=Photobacterium kishitanii TaxID=318456 RepID=A0AAX0YP61_9GAMM|nr:type VI secretion system tip protein VgrG [Photobacterium kishitanii]KJG59606.1 type VI secretion protein VgrG [Photobacterium kishitanii]KJG62901.1 type VI secretion protein VgrG [Photobacterium kishitanii]KJG71074.1 type VI secretion protein VgrG [Photobacterium kishitanii]PSX16967.1 type VI secretion system tip protein VgrG [Photobacterium kishitanii]PSX29401.1 type VI secretion system tip protein VgrG [Photobacterium kishitanii]